MTQGAGGSGVDAKRRREAHRGVMAVALAVSALVHGTVLVYGRFTVEEEGGAALRHSDASPEQADLRLVALAPEPDPPEALTSQAPAPLRDGTPVEVAAPSPAPSAEPPATAPLDIPGVEPVSADRLAGAAAAPATGVATFDLRPVAPGPPAPAPVPVEARGPGLLKRVLGGILKGVSVAVRVPCGPDGTPGGDPAQGGAPVIPEGGGMPGLPGVTDPGIPTGPDAVGMPEPQVIGMPAVPDATFGGTDGPVAGAGAGALGGLISCDDASGRRGGGLGGGIFRPGGGGSPQPVPRWFPVLAR